MTLVKILSILFIISLAGNVYLLNRSKINSSLANESSEIIRLEKQYPLLSQRAIYELPSDLLVNFLSLRSDLRSTVGPYGESFAFFFEYLPTGTSIGVNEKSEFASASLFKVPIVMAYYHMKERTGAKGDQVAILKESHIDREFGSLWKRGVGAELKLSEAVRLSLTESDNTAAHLLLSNIDEVDFDPVYEGLDIDLQVKNSAAVMTTKNFSSVLKALYFSSVLTKDDSQEILDLMTKSKFHDKLAAGVPDEVRVAHKIGVFEEKMFMDCGIVYVPRRNYLLCMVSASDEDVARERMSLVSNKVYDYVSSSKLPVKP